MAGGIPITRQTLLGLRVGTGAVLVSLYTIVTDVMAKVAADDRGEGLYD